MEGVDTHYSILPTLLSLLLTLVRAEAPFIVIIIVASCTAPQFAISSSLTSAGVIFLSKEHKGEVAWLSLRISTNHCGVCPNNTNNSKKTSLCDCDLMHLYAGFPVTHLDLDRIHISCPCQSCLWWHTNGSHHFGPPWYSCYTPSPERRRGRHIYLHWHFLQMFSELSR